jgi:hypothetical protein
MSTACNSVTQPEPTPESPLVTVQVLVDPVTLHLTGPTGYQILVPISVSNTSDKPIYYKPNCYFVIERADGAKWKETIFQECPAIQTPLQAIAPASTISLNVGAGVAGTFVVAPKSGTFRVHLLLLDNSAGSARLPDNAGYSRPFTVITG